MARSHAHPAIEWRAVAYLWIRGLPTAGPSRLVVVKKPYASPHSSSGTQGSPARAPHGLFARCQATARTCLGPPAGRPANSPRRACPAGPRDRSRAGTNTCGLLPSWRSQLACSVFSRKPGVRGSIIAPWWHRGVQPGGGSCHSPILTPKPRPCLILGLKAAAWLMWATSP